MKVVFDQSGCHPNFDESVPNPLSSCTLRREIVHTFLSTRFVRIVESDASSLLATLVQSHHLVERCSFHRHSTTSTVFHLLQIREALHDLPHIDVPTFDQPVLIQLICAIQSGSSEVGNARLKML